MKNFIIYRKPDEENITQFNIEKVVSESEFVKIGGFVMAPFDIKSSALYFTSHETEYKAIQKPVEKTYLNKRKDDVKYKSAIDSAISSVQNNALQKVVVSRQILLDGKLNAREVFVDLLENQKNAFLNEVKVLFEVQVREALKDGLIDATERADLEKLRVAFNLSEAQAEALFEQVQKET